nr:uncharacterized protein LOC123769441 [Procambarus clarkii]
MADLGSNTWRVLAVTALVVALSPVTPAQRTENCNTEVSPAFPNKVDVSCNCMQRLINFTQTIAELTINQTSCSNKGLELKWSDLETHVAPETLILVEAEVFISQKQAPTDNWNSSISKLLFIDSNFETLPAHAFRGMKLLKEVKFFGGSIGKIRSNAFNELNQLKLVEIANSSIEIIESNAFSNLTSLKDLAIVHTSVGIIESKAISLLRQNNDEQLCADVRTSVPDNNKVINDIVGRQLTSTDNLSLPKFGSRLLLFKNNIQTLKTQAITSQTLGFLIVGGNHIENIESRAFSMELYNECEISAALFISNTISNLGRFSLTALTARDDVPYQTFIALANNTFLKVEEHGFLLNKNVTVFSVEENYFQCSCDELSWIQYHADSQNEQELEKRLVINAKCLDGTNLIAFASSCTDYGEPSVQNTSPEPSLNPPVGQTPVVSGVSVQTMSLASGFVSVLTFMFSRILV